MNKAKKIYGNHSELHFVRKVLDFFNIPLGFVAVIFFVLIGMLVLFNALVSLFFEERQLLISNEMLPCMIIVTVLAYFLIKFLENKYYKKLEKNKFLAGFGEFIRDHCHGHYSLKKSILKSSRGEFDFKKDKDEYRRAIIILDDIVADYEVSEESKDRFNSELVCDQFSEVFGDKNTLENYSTKPDGFSEQNLELISDLQRKNLVNFLGMVIFDAKELCRIGKSEKAKVLLDCFCSLPSVINENQIAWEPILTYARKMIEKQPDWKHNYPELLEKIKKADP